MLAPTMSRRTPMGAYLRLRCKVEQRERWRLAAQKRGEDESAIARELMDKWAASVLDKPTPKRRPRR